MGFTWKRTIFSLVLTIALLQVIHITLLSRLETVRSERRRNRSTTKFQNEVRSESLISLHEYSLLEMEKDRQLMVQAILESSVLDSFGELSIINNWVRADFLGSRNHVRPDITLVSLTSLTEIHHLGDIVERWQGPISIGLFCLAKDIPIAIQLIILLRKCYPVIRQNTTFHLVHPLHHMPLSNIDRSDNVYNQWHISSQETQSLSSCIKSSQIIASIRAKSSANYENNGVPFPNNLLRNVARRNSRTQYIFVIDIDLVPNQNLYQDFIEFANENKLFDEESIREKRVFVVPSFETHSSLTPTLIPKEKKELLKAIKTRTIRPFYFELCWKCQKYTDYEAWIRETLSPKLAVSFEVHWHDPWEPFYISHNSAPMYDERFRQYGFNRISQVCELYIAGYKFSVLNNAFLVHKGLKKPDSFHKNKDVELERNRILFRHFKKELKIEYTNTNRHC